MLLFYNHLYVSHSFIRVQNYQLKRRKNMIYVINKAIIPTKYVKQHIFDHYLRHPDHKGEIRTN